MAFQFATPEKFNFPNPEEWPKWIKRFGRFRQVSGLDKKSEEEQVCALLYSMGDKAEDILDSLSLTDEDKKKYDTVKTKLDAYFLPQRNVIYE